MTTPLEFQQGIGTSSWRFTSADGTRYLLSLAHLAGWMFNAPESELAYVPVPTIEVRVLRPGASTYRNNVARLEIPGANKRHIPMNSAEKVAAAYRDTIAAATSR